jgi:hypothetical protein
VTIAPERQQAKLAKPGTATEPERADGEREEERVAEPVA